MKYGQSLSGRLFDEDPEHDAYRSVASGALQRADRSAIPKFARQMSLNHLQHIRSMHGGQQFELWIRDLEESFADGYVLADAEDWKADADVAAYAIRVGMQELNRSRPRSGIEPITPSDSSTWVLMILLGLHADVEEWSQLHDYVRLQGAWERLDWVYPTHRIVGEHLSQPSAGELHAWQFANRLAWHDGIYLSILHRLGLLSSEAGEHTLDQESVDKEMEQLLTVVLFDLDKLFELDRQHYQMEAAHMSETAHAVPEGAKQFRTRLIAALVDEKIIRDYGKLLEETFECGYVLCTNETWESLDEDRLLELIDEGLQRLIAEEDARDPRLLLGDPEYQIQNVSNGIAGHMPNFAGLRGYLEAQPAFNRICVMREMMVAGIVNGVRLKARDDVEPSLYFSFWFGVVAALMDQLRASRARFACPPS